MTSEHTTKKCWRTSVVQLVGASAAAAASAALGVVGAGAGDGDGEAGHGGAGACGMGAGAGSGDGAGANARAEAEAAADDDSSSNSDDDSELEDGTDGAVEARADAADFDIDSAVDAIIGEVYAEAQKGDDDRNSVHSHEFGAEAMDAIDSEDSDGDL